jgi:hypothetical protein
VITRIFFLSFYLFFIFTCSGPKLDNVRETKQSTASMVTILHHNRQPSASEQFGNGLLCSRAFWYAVLCCAEHCVLPMENEQGPRSYHVPILLCFCRRFAWIWVWYDKLSGLGYSADDLLIISNRSVFIEFKQIIFLVYKFALNKHISFFC